MDLFTGVPCGPLKPTSDLSAEVSQSSGTNQPQQEASSIEDEGPDSHVQVIHDLRLQLQNQDAFLSELQWTCQKLLISNQQKDSEIQQKDSEIQQKDSEIQQKDSEIQQKDSEIQQKDSEIQMLMTRQAGTEAQIVQLHETTSNQYRELQMCKDDLFRLQPVVQVTDTEIMKQYETLCQGVSNWVDLEIFRFVYKFGAAAYDTEAITDGGSSYVKMLLNCVPGAGEYLVSTVIHMKMQETFFGEDVILFGLDAGIAGLVLSTQQHMAKLQPERDIATINTWRSETLKAMATIPEMVERRKMMLSKFTADLFHSLQDIFPWLGGEPESKKQLHHDISKHAAQLESSIHLSSTKYRFEYMADVLEYPYNPVTAKLLADIAWVDVETRKTLKPDSPVIPDCQGLIGTPLLLIEPFLIRQDHRERKNLMLRKSKILIKLYAPLARVA